MLIPFFLKLIDGKSKNEKEPITFPQTFFLFYPYSYFLMLLKLLGTVRNGTVG